jgi:hypothetical protein
VTSLQYVVDEGTGLAIVRPYNRMFAPHVKGYGTVTYRCHTCGELIPKHWETFFFDPEPATAWASDILPPVMAPTMTTHHDWHMAATQEA